MRNWMMDWDFIFVPLICLAIVIAIVVGVVYVAFVLNERTCEKIASSMEMNNRYSLLTGCMIEVEKDTWIPLESYRWIGESL